MKTTQVTAPSRTKKFLVGWIAILSVRKAYFHDQYFAEHKQNYKQKYKKKNV